MSMSAILIAALVMSVLGLLFGALLGVTGRVFKVPVNEKAEALRECLPGANCGACGFPGCDGYAAAVADGKADGTSHSKNWMQETKTGSISTCSSC